MIAFDTMPGVCFGRYRCLIFRAAENAKAPRARELNFLASFSHTTGCDCEYYCQRMPTDSHSTSSGAA